MLSFVAVVSLPRLLVLLIALGAAPPVWAAPPNTELARARELLDGLRYAEASRALEAARALPGNDRDTLLQVLELQGVVAAMLQQPDKARAAFRTLLVLAPDHRLTGDYAPRVVTPFFEARAWVDDQKAALRVEAAPAVEGEHSVERVVVRVVMDSLNLGRAVRFHLSEDDAPWTERESTLDRGEASVAVRGARVLWWAELLDENKAVLGTVGSATAPLWALSLRSRALVAAQPPELSSAPTSPWRIAAGVSLGLAVGAGGTGGYFGWRSREARDSLASAPVDEGGLTTGFTQREAYALDERARSSARLANILFGVAGAAAIVGGTFWVLGAPVSVSATPGGVAVGGTLP